MELKTGDKIPMFALTNQQGEEIKIENLLKDKNLVLYFYPKDETAGCTKQACAFRDSYQDFKEAGAEVVGISSDDEKSHVSFAIHHKLPFVLLSDKGGLIRKQFGVPADMLGLIPGRVTYIIDKEGIIRYKFNSQLRIEKHITEALRIIKAL